MHQHEINWKLIQRNKLRAKGRVRAHHFVVYEEVNLMAFPSEEEQLRKFRNDEVAQHYFEVLRTLISKKSIFAQNIGLYDVAAYLGEIFSRVGAEVTIDETYAAPFVLAKFKSPNPDAKTIIFYQHYDTVPADNDQPWTDDPFRLTVRKGYMYGRGVDDDKGHITARLTALRKYIREVGEPSC